MTSVVVIGGGPAGYEAALVARQLGAEVVLIERDGVGGSAVLTDCVPSKTLIATADIITSTRESHALGVLINGSESRDATISVNLTTVNGRVMELPMPRAPTSKPASSGRASRSFAAGPG